MNHNLIRFVFFVFSTAAFSQTQENLLMERFFMNAFNPAYVGSEGKSVAIVTRTTWSGIADSPRSNYLFYSGAPKKNLSFGVSVIQIKYSSIPAVNIHSMLVTNLNWVGNTP